MPNEKPKTYKQQLKDYFYGPPRDWDVWLPEDVKGRYIDPESYLSHYDKEAATDPYFQKRIWELLFGEGLFKGPIQIFFTDENEDNLEINRSSVRDRYVVPKSDHQEPGSFSLLDSIFNDLSLFFRSKYSTEYPAIDEDQESILRLCMELKNQFTIFNKTCDNI